MRTVGTADEVTGLGRLDRDEHPVGQAVVAVPCAASTADPPGERV